MEPLDVNWVSEIQTPNRRTPSKHLRRCSSTRQDHPPKQLFVLFTKLCHFAPPLLKGGRGKMAKLLKATEPLGNAFTFSAAQKPFAPRGEAGEACTFCTCFFFSCHGAGANTEVLCCFFCRGMFVYFVCLFCRLDAIWLFVLLSCVFYWCCFVLCYFVLFCFVFCCDFQCWFFICLQ